MGKGLAFSSKDRTSLIEKMGSSQYDLIVIGGGITGVGIALDAVTRGMTVCLVEKGDFASGTSGKSTKLIHGGLRYLKQFEFNLVKEVGRERAILHDLAPHIVVPEKMVLPLIKGGSLGRVMTSIGLYIYDFLADVEGEDKRRMLDKEEVLEIEPLLPSDKLLGGSIYAEYRTDDARLTIEVAKTAYDKGADLINYTSCVGFEYADDKVSGITCTDHITDREFTVRGNVVVNATGPWVDELRSKDETVTGKRLYLTKGVHIVVSRDRFPVQHSLYFDVPGDNRMIFAIPRLGVTYIGTTDTYYNSDKDNISVEDEDVEYLLNAVNLTFPDLHLKSEEIISSWAGVRPLIYEDGKSASEISRKDEIFETARGLISIAGGKLTGYRKMAERVVDLVAKKMPDKTLEPVQTESIHLTDPFFASDRQVREETSKLEKAIIEEGLAGLYASYLIHNYGPAVWEIWQAALAIDEDRSIEEKLILAELDHCFSREMMLKPLDFIVRRTGRIYFLPESVTLVKQIIFPYFQNRMNWTAPELQENHETWDQMVQSLHHFT